MYLFQCRVYITLLLTNWRHLDVWVGRFLNSCWDPFLTNFVAFFWTFFWTFFGCFDSTCRKLDSHVENVSKQYCFTRKLVFSRKARFFVQQCLLESRSNGSIFFKKTQKCTVLSQNLKLLPYTSRFIFARFVQERWCFIHLTVQNFEIEQFGR